MPPPQNLTPEQAQALADALREAAAGTLNLADAQKKLQGINTEGLTQLAELNVQRAREAATMEASIEQAERAAKHAATDIERTRAQIALNDTKLEQLKQEHAQGRLTAAAYKDQADELIRLNKELRDSSAAIEDANARFEALAKTISNLPFGQTIVGLMRMYQQFKALSKVNQAAWIGGAMLTRMVQFTLALYNTEAAFMKATGATREYARGATEAYLATRQYGVTAAAASESAQALYGTFTDFTFASTAQQQSLTQTGALLNRLGVSYSDYAKNIQISTKALGMSTEEAEANQADLALMAQRMGVPVAQLSSQYASMAPKLAKLGSTGNKAFKDLARVSKITGLEMEKVLAITDKFDTFEGAAEQAGKLNAALGGNFVNAMDLMMETDPAKRFEMIRDSITQTGLSFEDMSYYQKKFYVDSIDGLNDVGDLAMMMSGNMDLLAGSTEKTQDEMIKLKKAAAATQTLSESWQSLVASLTPALTPLIDGLAKIFGFFQDPKNEKYLMFLKVGLGALAIGFAAVAAATTLLSIGIIAATIPLIIMGAKIAAVVAGVMALGAGIIALGRWLFKKKQSPYTFTEGVEILAGTDGKTGFGAVNAQMKGVETQTKRTQTAMVDNKAAVVSPNGGPQAAAASTASGAPINLRSELHVDGEKMAEIVQTYTNRQRATAANNRF